eukprot:4953865-Amphidinium_carterae.1
MQTSHECQTQVHAQKNREPLSNTGMATMKRMPLQMGHCRLGQPMPPLLSLAGKGNMRCWTTSRRPVSDWLRRS